MVGGDAGLANGVAWVASHQEMALPVDDALHLRSIPDAGVSSSHLPVCAEVKNVAFMVANNLHIESIHQNLAIPEVLLHSIL